MASDRSGDESDALRKRRERLEALKSKRVETSAPKKPVAQDPFAAAGEAGPMGGGFGAMGQPGAKRARQRKMLMKVYNVLTQTPADDNGLVPETPFTEAGVARLMEILRTRSADASQPGAKVAEGVLRFITPDEGEEATASGASLEKLQMIARRIEAFRGKGGGAARRGGAF